MIIQLNVSEYDLMRILSDYIPGRMINAKAFERYEPDAPVFDDSADLWDHLYLLGNEYTDVMVFRAYIEAQGASVGVYCFPHDCRWVVASNYAIPTIVAEYTR